VAESKSKVLNASNPFSMSRNLRMQVRFEVFNVTNT